MVELSLHNFDIASHTPIWDELCTEQEALEHIFVTKLYFFRIIARVQLLNLGWLNPFDDSFE